MQLVQNFLFNALQTMFEVVSKIFNRFFHLFDNIPVGDIWRAFVPNDIYSVLSIVFNLLMIVAVFGLVKKVVVFFG